MAKRRYGDKPGDDCVSKPMHPLKLKRERERQRERYREIERGGEKKTKSKNIANNNCFRCKKEGG